MPKRGKPKQKPIPWETKLTRIGCGLGLMVVAIGTIVATWTTIEGRKISPTETETSTPTQPSSVEACATAIAYLNDFGQVYRDPQIYCPGYIR